MSSFASRLTFGFAYDLEVVGSIEEARAEPCRLDTDFVRVFRLMYRG